MAFDKDLGFASLGGGGGLLSVSVCGVCPDLLFLCRYAKSTANVSVSPSAAGRCRLRVPTAQPRQPRLDPRPAIRPLLRYTPENLAYQGLGFRELYLKMDCTAQNE